MRTSEINFVCNMQISYLVSQDEKHYYDPGDNACSKDKND